MEECDARNGRRQYVARKRTHQLSVGEQLHFFPICCVYSCHIPWQVFASKSYSLVDLVAVAILAIYVRHAKVLA
jgi:hypothetical protein